MKQFSNIILYTLLLLHFPLFYFGNNLIDLSIPPFIELLGITFILGFIIIIIISIILKFIKKTTNPIIILISIFLFFSYGIFYQSFIDAEFHVRHIYLLPFFVMVFLIALKYSPNSTKKTTQILFTILIVLILSDLVIFFSEVEYGPTGEYWDFSDDFYSMDLEKFPSIIWIIPDEYPSYDSLQSLTSYDNSNFINNLIDIGFEIKDIRSNYDYTEYSIVSTMNMDYLTKIDKQYSMASEMENSRLIELLKFNNYELTHLNGVGSYHLEKFDNYLCDSNIIMRHHEFFQTNLMRLILIFTEPLYGDIVRNHAGNVECYFEELKQLKNIDLKQKFVLAHVLLPHSPYLTKDEFGSLKSLDSSIEFSEKFVSNIKIFNEELIKSLPIIMENNPNTIILIMSDHGIRFDADQHRKTDEFQKFRYENFLAIYLPNNFKLKDDINSNVNLFRGILQNASNDVPILEDRFFQDCHRESFKEIYDFENYTLGSKMLKENCIKN